MDINDLKSDWNSANGPKRTTKELAMMTTISKHPQLRRIRVKLIIESTLLILFLSVYYNALDGDQRPQWLNIAFVTSALLYILNDIVGFINITGLTRGANIVEALKSLKGRLQKLKMLSMVTSVAFGLSLIALLSSGIPLTAMKVGILAGMITTLMIFIYLSHRNWSQRIAQVAASIDAFRE